MKNKTIFLIVISLIAFLYIFLYFSTYIRTPFVMDGDSFFHIGNSERIINNGNISENLYYNLNKKDWYSYFPLFNILPVILSLNTSMNLETTFVMLSLFMIFLIIIIYLMLARKIKNKYLILIISVLLIIPIANSSIIDSGYISFYFYYFTPSFFSLIFILILYYLLIEYVETKQKRLLIIFSIFLLSLIFYHMESAFRFYISFLILLAPLGIILKYSRKQIFHIFLCIVIIALFSLLINFHIFSNDFNLIGKAKTFVGDSTIEKEVKNLNYNNLLGENTILFSILFIFILARNRKKIDYKLLILISIFIISFLLGLQYLLNINFFSDRFIKFTLFPLMIISSISIVYLLKNLKTGMKITFIFLIVIIILVSFSAKISEANLGTSWDYIQDIEKMKNSISPNQTIVISDYWTLFKVCGKIPNLQPSYNFDRPGKFQDYYKQLQQEPDIRGVFYSNPNESANYLLKNKIDYIIIDKATTKSRIPVNYSKFEDKNLFKVVYDSKYFIIYTTKDGK